MRYLSNSKAVLDNLKLEHYMFLKTNNDFLQYTSFNKPRFFQKLKLMHVLHLLYAFCRKIITILNTILP